MAQHGPPTRPGAHSRSDRRSAKQAAAADETKERTELVLADNRKARFNYAIARKVEAGLVLTGTEIKSVRAGRTNLSDGYAKVDRGQIYLRNVHIAPWQNAVGFKEQDPTRPRKLLLHKAEMLS